MLIYNSNFQALITMKFISKYSKNKNRFIKSFYSDNLEKRFFNIKLI